MIKKILNRHRFMFNGVDEDLYAEHKLGRASAGKLLGRLDVAIAVLYAEAETINDQKRRARSSEEWEKLRAEAEALFYAFRTLVRKRERLQPCRPTA